MLTTPWGDRYDSSADEVLDYDGLAAVRDGAWAGMLADGFAFAVLGLSLGLVVCHLARGRGRVAALVGALLTTAGGILFAMGGLAFATLAWFASGLAEESGRTLVDYANDHPGHLLGATMAGFFLFTVGGLVLASRCSAPAPSRWPAWRRTSCSSPPSSPRCPVARWTSCRSARWR